MTDAVANAAARAPHPLIEQLLSRAHCAEVTTDNIEEVIARTPHTLLFFSEDPQIYRETLDLAVILPELLNAFAGRFSIGVLLPHEARALAPRYGIKRWPALVLLRDGKYVGTIEGVRDWDDYLSELRRLLDAPTSRPPTIGIAVKATSQHDSHDCHP